MRETLNLNFKWAFSKSCNEVPTKLPEDWYWVNLPHTWNAIDGQDGNNDYFRGDGWYVKVLEKIDIPEGEEFYLEFLGANSSATVYVNGKEVGSHDGGYSTWRVNVTDALTEIENVIAVKVNNAPNDHVYPQFADFTFYGGLYRDVNLIAVPKSHFDLDYIGSSALKITPVLEDGKWTINVKSYPVNVKEGQTLVTRVNKPCGCLVSEKVTDPKDSEVVFEIEKPHLWNGTKDPYLYTVTVELKEGDKVLDSKSDRCGLRTFVVDPNKGFILNGEEYPLRGVSRHQDRWALGNALTEKEHKEDIDYILEAGFATIRLAHYQHSQTFYNLCDEAGLVLWAEIPYISKHLPNGRDNTISQMRELVVQNYNHPSIICWGLSNEITMDGADDPDLIENHQILNDLVKSIDSTRFTTLAAVSNCPTNAKYLQIPDTVSWNHYFGWYGGSFETYGPWFDKFHAENPELPVGISEYGCEALNWHNSNPGPGDYSEEYQAMYHEALIKFIDERPYLWATHVWNMYDFGCDGRNEGGENGQNHKGLMTFDRSYKKDSYYAYKAWLAKDPFVHIGGKRYVDRVEDVTSVTVYSNANEVELIANGKSLGVQKGKWFFKFEVPLEGKVVLVAKANGLEDTSVINKVAEANPAYTMTEKHAVLNWFDVTTVEGCFDLNSKVGEIGENKEALDAFVEFLNIFGAGGNTVGMVSTLNSWSLLRLIGLMGMMNVKPNKEQLLDLNAKLNKIHK